MICHMRLNVVKSKYVVEVRKSVTDKVESKISGKITETMIYSETLCMCFSDDRAQKHVKLRICVGLKTGSIGQQLVQ